MAASMLRDSSTSSLSQELIATIEEASQRGGEIVKQVLAFARGMGGVQENLRPDVLVSQVGRIVSKTFPKSISHRQQVPEDLWSINVDLTKLHQVLLNLCVNARDAMPEGGILTISGENREVDEQCASMIPGAVPGCFVVLKVSDTGSGIPEAVRKRMFDPFFTTKEPDLGTGLGLSTVLEIVKDHRGFLTVDSELGKGSSFNIFLPAKILPSPLSARQDSTSVLPQGNGACILLVDDEPSILAIMGQVLVRNGYEVITAQDGIEALTVFCSSPKKVALAITDVMMPQMDGVNLARGLLKICPDLPIIASSGHAEESRRTELAELGIRAFLKKPYSAGELLKTLDRILSEVRSG